MKKLWFVAREELLIALRSWSFYLTLLLMSGAFAAAGALEQIGAGLANTPLSNVETILSEEAELTAPVGVVDVAQLITLPHPYLVFYETVEQAQTAMQTGEVESFYVIPADYLTHGRVQQFSLTPQLMSSTDTAVAQILEQNLLAQLPVPLNERLATPAEVDWQGAPPPTFSFIPADIDQSRLATAGLVLGLFSYFLNVSGFALIGALERESSTRVMEVVITSTAPVQLVGGKVLGLTLLAMIEVVVSLTAGYVVYGSEEGAAALPLDILLLCLPFFLFGYLTYCALMVLVAVFFPQVGESLQWQTVLRLLLLSPVMGAIFILPNASSSAAVWLTLTPFTSPLLMPFRLLLTPVPAGQIALSLGLLILFACGLFWFSLRLFRAQSLLTGRRPSLGMVWDVLVRS